MPAMPRADASSLGVASASRSTMPWISASKRSTSSTWRVATDQVSSAAA